LKKQGGLKKQATLEPPLFCCQKKYIFKDVCTRQTLFRGMRQSRRFFSIVIHGNYFSQPSRAVIWLLKLNRFPFKMKKVVPRVDTIMDDYKFKFPTGLAPGMEDDSFCLSEASIIMQYLCEKHEWDQWWPRGYDEIKLKRKAKIGEYLSNQHHSTRSITLKVVRPHIQDVFSQQIPTNEEREQRRLSAAAYVNSFQDVFLREDGFVNGMDEPTIADLLAYCEVGQLTMLKILPDFENTPRVKLWASRMRQLAHHDDVHRTVLKVTEMEDNQKAQ
jgi:glutathione S-transferase